MQQVSFERITKGPANGSRRLGCAPAKSNAKALMLRTFLDTEKEPPVKTNFWPRRTAFKPRHFGNIQFGDCTRAKQAWGIMRMQRLEGRNTPKITDEEVIRVYKEMTTRRYGADWLHDPVGSDLGAFETDALDDWRNKETTIRDTTGHAYTIEAYVRVNHFYIKEVKNAIATAGAKGIAVCFDLPIDWAYQEGNNWDLPEGQQPIGPFLPGSWGGHSMWAIDYDEKGVFLDSTWLEKIGKISWTAFSAYASEAHLVIDSINEWKKAKTKVDLSALKKAVNSVSSIQIK